MPSVPIHLADRSYDAVIGAGVLRELGQRAAALVPGRRAFLITDDALPPAIVSRAVDSLAAAGFTVTRASVHPTEPNKSLGTFARLLDELAATKHERADPVIALGGGIVTDLAGFVAASYRRGVPVIQCPTTLLAMVDAAVGGKTGVNLVVGKGSREEGIKGSSHGRRATASLDPSIPSSLDPFLLKNMIGAFWQPRLVLVDTDALASLPDRHFRAGLAECLKHGLLSAGAISPGGTDGARSVPSAARLFEWTSTHLPKILGRDSATLAELIERNIRVKAAVVAGDEREEKPSSHGGRALLNLGHTFAHALESFPALSPTNDPADAPLQHGEAVALGLVAAAAASAAMGRLSQADAERVRDAVARAGLPTSVTGLPPDRVLIDAMAHDKKASGGKLRLILPITLGECAVFEAPDERVLSSGWGAIRRSTEHA